MSEEREEEIDEADSLKEKEEKNGDFFFFSNL
jgi:hypothetical protein